MKFTLALIAYAIVSAFGLYKMKGASEVMDAAFLIGLVFYCAGFLAWLVILRMYPLSIAFPAAAGALIVATQFFGIVMLREQASWMGMLGVVLIAFGIALLSASRGAS